MKKAILFLILMGLFIQVSAPPPGYYLTILKTEACNPYERLWQSTCMVESGNNPYAIGDTTLNGYSYGIVQIRKVRLDDYNNRTGHSYSLDDMFSPQISKDIWYFYATQFHPEDIVSICRNWNGLGDSSLEYVKKIRKQLNKL